jgi:hypothetical protein
MEANIIETGDAEGVPEQVCTQGWGWKHGTEIALLLMFGLRLSDSRRLLLDLGDGHLDPFPMLLLGFFCLVIENIQRQEDKSTTSYHDGRCHNVPQCFAPSGHSGLSLRLC